MTLVSPEYTPRALPRPEPIDPLSLVRDGPMERDLYLNGRTAPDGSLRDGFNVYCAPRRNGHTAAEVRTAYASDSAQSDFSASDFVSKHFDVDRGSLPVREAPEGMGIETFITTVLKPAQVRDMSHYTDEGPHLALPYPDYAPGDRFIHTFPHDSFYESLDPQRLFNILDNESHQIMRYGYPFNFNAIASAGRTQTPFYSYKIERAMATHANGKEILQHYLEPLERYFNFFEKDQKALDASIQGRHGRALRIQGHRLAGHFDNMPVDYEARVGGRRESLLEDHESAEEAMGSLTGKARERAWKHFMISAGAIAESCYDFSVLRWSRDQKSIHKPYILEIAPLELNSNLVHMARLIAMAYEDRGDEESIRKALRYRANAEARAHAINELMWNPELGIYQDVHLSGRRTPAISAAMAAPLFAGGIVPSDRAIRVGRYLRDNHLQEYGLPTTTQRTKQQWDGLVWAGPAYQAGEGLLIAACDEQRAGGEHSEELAEISDEVWGRTANGTKASYVALHTTPERFDGNEPRVSIRAGEYDEVRNIGMSAAVYMETTNRSPLIEARNPDAHWRRYSHAKNIGPLVVPRRSIIIP